MSLIKLFPPESFRKDPYGYLTNQIGHIYLGFNAMVLYCFLFDKVGTYPAQGPAFALVVAGYFLGWEIIVQGWRRWDTLEDALYFAWGAGVFLFIDMEWVIDRLFVACLAVAVPLIWGVVVRVERARNGRGKATKPNP